MLLSESVIAVFGEDREAHEAVKKLETAGFPIENLSVVGKKRHAEEKVVGYYNIGNRMTFWGKRGAFWGALWGLFLGGVSLTIPAVGPIMVLGYLAAIVVSAVEGAIIIGGLSALGGALYSVGVSPESIVQYEKALKADGFLVIVHGALGELKRASAMLAHTNPLRLDLHDGLKTNMLGPSHRDSGAAPPTALRPSHREMIGFSPREFDAEWFPNLESRRSGRH